MTAQGHPYTRFRRALQTGSTTLALTTAAELGRLSIEDAFALILLLADREPKKFERAAARWLGRYCLETKGVPLAEVLLVGALLDALAGDEPERAAEHLAAIGKRRGHPKLDEEVRRWRVERQRRR